MPKSRNEPGAQHTDCDVQRTDDEQDTGTHTKPGTPEARGADRFGGTRTGAENVERDPRSEADRR